MGSGPVPVSGNWCVGSLPAHPYFEPLTSFMAPAGRPVSITIRTRYGMGLAAGFGGDALWRARSWATPVPRKGRQFDMSGNRPAGMTVHLPRGLRQC